MLQQHKVSKGDAIRFAALHFRGKTYAWWIFESCYLKDANTSSYFRFIGTMMERFGGRKSKTHAEKQTKILHVKEKNINLDPLWDIVEKAGILHHTLLEARYPSHILAQERMEVSFPKGDPILGEVAPTC